MAIKPRCYKKVMELIAKGVDIPNPLSIDIGDEVSVDFVSGDDVTIYPGCRIYGEKTVISAGTRIGYEGPVTIDNCQLGPKVELKGGFFTRSVFLEKAKMGLGGHVREGSILEEEANGAHCVGLKQTILFPFVTLGSLINFCDCLMAGGTSRNDHSEVGSSYIHFNYTPEGDKTTASLIGDVPRGVMLNRPAIFLGGQGGMVGPVRMGYGNVVTAGSILRSDYPEDGKLIAVKSHSSMAIKYTAGAYKNFNRIVGNNIIYLANLMALREWYRQVRHPFFERQEFGGLIHTGLLDALTMAREERVKRLQVLVKKARPVSEGQGEISPELLVKKEFCERFAEIESLFAGDITDDQADRLGEEFLSRFNNETGGRHTDYITAVRGLPVPVSEKGTAWLQRIVDVFCEKVDMIAPSLRIIKR